MLFRSGRTTSIAISPDSKIAIVRSADHRLVRIDLATGQAISPIAEALAPRCKALGMTVVGVTSGKRTVPGFDRMESKDRLAQVVGEFDYFVLLTPYSKETHHLVNAAVLGAMKPRSFLVNLARGGVVDETALIEVLKNGPLAGAADRKSTRLNSSHIPLSRMPSSA